MSSRERAHPSLQQANLERHTFLGTFVNENGSVRIEMIDDSGGVWTYTPANAKELELVLGDVRSHRLAHQHGKSKDICLTDSYLPPALQAHQK